MRKCQTLSLETLNFIIWKAVYYMDALPPERSGTDPSMPEDLSHLISVGRAYFANDFPNHSHLGCPEPSILSAVINTGEPPGDELRAHLFGCSQCFRYFQAALAIRQPGYSSPISAWGRIKAGFAGKRRLMVVSALTACVAVACLSWVYYSSLSEKESPAISHLTAKSTEKGGMSAPTPAPSGEVMPSASRNNQAGSKSANTNNSTTRHEKTPALVATNRITVDFSERQLLRSGDVRGSSEHPIEIRQGLNNVSVKLPGDSPKERYKLSLVDAYGNDVVIGRSHRPKGKTASFILDTREIEPKSYRLCLSRAGEAPSCSRVVLQEKRAPRVK